MEMRLRVDLLKPNLKISKEVSMSENEKIRDGVGGLKVNEIESFLTKNGVENAAAYITAAVYAKAKDAVYRAKRNKGMKAYREEIESLKAQLAK